MKKEHLKDLLSNKERNDQLVLQFSDFILDFTHEKMNLETLQLFEKLVKENNLQQKIKGLFNGV